MPINPASTQEDASITSIDPAMSRADVEAALEDSYAKQVADYAMQKKIREHYDAEPLEDPTVAGERLPAIIKIKAPLNVLEERANSEESQRKVLDAVQSSYDLMAGYRKDGLLFTDQQEVENTADLDRVTKVLSTDGYHMKSSKKRNLEKMKRNLERVNDLILDSNRIKSEMREVHDENILNVVKLMEENPVFAADMVLRARISAAREAGLGDVTIKDLTDAQIRYHFPSLSLRYQPNDVRKILAYRQSDLNSLTSRSTSRVKSNEKTPLQKVAPRIKMPLVLLRSKNMLFPGYDGDDGFLEDAVALVRDADTIAKNSLRKSFTTIPSEDHAVPMYAMEGDAEQYATFLTMRDILLLYGQRVAGRQFAQEGHERIRRAGASGRTLSHLQARDEMANKAIKDIRGSGSPTSEQAQFDERFKKLQTEARRKISLRGNG